MHRQICHLSSRKPSPFFADPTDKLLQLEQTLHSQGSAAVLAVHGMGGVGKTELVLQYIAKQRKSYYGIWWFRANSRALLYEDCATFCDTPGFVPLGKGVGPIEGVRAHLSTEPRWLLVYDHANDEEILRDCLPDRGPHHVIITSRRSNREYEKYLHLDAWGDNEAIDFLRQRLPQASDDQRHTLAHSLGGLPLALEQACAYLKKNHVGVEAYLDGINDFERQSSLLDRADSSVAPHSVQATLSLAFKRLSQAARDLLHRCAWLAPEAVPEYLFTENSELLPPELAACASNVLDWRETVAELASYALCRMPVEGMDSPVLLFHPLIQAVVRTQRRESLKVDIGQSLVLLRNTFPENAGQPDHWPRCEALMPHVLQFETWHRKEIVQNADRLGWLFDRLADYLFEAHGLYGEAERLQRKAVAIAREYYGEDHPNTLAAKNNLANIRQTQGDLTGSRELQESVLAARQRLLGAEHPSTLTSMNNLASTLYAFGDFSGAREFQESVLAARLRLLGEEHPDALTSMNNLASTLYALGEFAGAQKLQESVLKTSHRVLSDQHPHTIASMSNLADTLLAQNNPTDACKLQESALAASRQTLGKEHPLSSNTAFALLVMLLTIGDEERALEVFSENFIWLLAYDPARLTTTHRAIREQLLSRLMPESGVIDMVTGSFIA